MEDCRGIGLTESGPVNRWSCVSHPSPYSPINDRDIFEQTEALLEMALPSCPIVNWGGDEPVPDALVVQLFRRTPGCHPRRRSVIHLPNTQPGVVADSTKRMAFTGPCRVGWREGMKALAEARTQQPLPGVQQQHR